MGHHFGLHRRSAGHVHRDRYLHFVQDQKIKETQVRTRFHLHKSVKSIQKFTFTGIPGQRRKNGCTIPLQTPAVITITAITEFKIIKNQKRID